MNIDKEEMKDITVNSIILTSKPNLYFFINEEDIQYYDWIEFKALVASHFF